MTEDERTSLKDAENSKTVKYSLSDEKTGEVNFQIGNILEEDEEKQVEDKKSKTIFNRSASVLLAENITDDEKYRQIISTNVLENNGLVDLFAKKVLKFFIY